LQNKIHFAIHGHTAAELIVERADAEKDFMGLLTFKGNQSTLAEARAAKNYLDEKELRAMGHFWGHCLKILYLSVFWRRESF